MTDEYILSTSIDVPLSPMLYSVPFGLNIFPVIWNLSRHYSTVNCTVPYENQLHNRKLLY